MDLLNIVKDLLPADAVQNAAQKTGESEQGVGKFISAAIPTILAGLVSKSSGSDNGLLSIAKSAFGSGALGNLGAFLGNNGSDTHGGFSIWDTLKNLLGGNANISTLVSSLAGFAGVKTESANALLGMSSVATLGALGQHAEKANLDDKGFSSLLASQSDKLSSWFPAGFNASSILPMIGLGGVSSMLGKHTEAPKEETVRAATDAQANYVAPSESPKKGNGWLVPLIILAAVAGLIWWFMKGCNKEDAKNTATSGAVVNAADTAIAAASSAATAVAGSVDSFGNWVADLGSDKTFKLTDGTEMKVGENSTEYKLFNFITNPEMKVDTVNKSANWYSFNRVYFQTGKSILTAESQTQVKNIALILKNYPNAKIKMGGYTDNTGNADVNKRISDERAKIVAKELVKLGAGKDQVVEAVGYGAEFPIASNDTPEGKAQNRRVDLKVATK